MIITLDFAQACFDTFNRQIFGGKLPRVPITLGRAQHLIGTCSYSVPHGRSRSSEALKHAYGFRLRFSTCFDMPREMWEDTVIHEMIHLALAVGRISDDGVHGTAFRQLMERINREHHRHVCVRHDNSDGQTVCTQPVRWVVAALVKYASGTLGIKVLPRVKPTIVRYYQVVSRQPDVLSVELSLTRDPFFNRYPKSGALKVYAISAEDVAMHLKDSIPVLCRDGDVVVCTPPLHVER